MTAPTKNLSGGLRFKSDAGSSLHKAATLLGSKGGAQSSPAKQAAAKQNASLPRK